MAAAPWRSLDERVAQLEAIIIQLREHNDHLREVNEEFREHLENAHEAEAILRRVQQQGSPLEPMKMPPPTPRKAGRHKRNRDRTDTYLRVIKVATPLALGALIIAGAVVPASSLSTTHAAASSVLPGWAVRQLEQRASAEAAGLCNGQLPDAGTLPGAEVAVAQGRSPLGFVAYGDDVDRVIFGADCDTKITARVGH